MGKGRELPVEEPTHRPNSEVSRLPIFTARFLSRSFFMASNTPTRNIVKEEADGCDDPGCD